MFIYDNCEEQRAQGKVRISFDYMVRHLFQLPEGVNISRVIVNQEQKMLEVVLESGEPIDIHGVNIDDITEESYLPLTFSFCEGVSIPSVRPIEKVHMEKETYKKIISLLEDEALNE